MSAWFQVNGAPSDLYLMRNVESSTDCPYLRVLMRGSALFGCPSDLW